MYRNSIEPDKRNYFPASALLFLILLFPLLITSCEEPGFIGLEIQPHSDRFRIVSYQDREINSTTIERDSVFARNLFRSLLGNVSDPVFGHTRAAFMVQLGLTYYNHDFGSSPYVDSLVLYLRIDDFQGDKEDPQELTIYEVVEIIDPQTPYYTNLDPWTMADGSKEIARYTFNLNAGDTIISVPVTDSYLRDKFLFAPDSTLQSTGTFISYFRGLYLTAENKGDTGAIFTIDLNHDNSHLVLYYGNTEFPDSSFMYEYVITGNANRINLIENDYSTAVFNDLSGNEPESDSVFYIQGAAGVLSRLYFGDLHLWRDTMSIDPVSINSARLIIPVETMDNTVSGFPLPPSLIAYERNEDGTLVAINDFVLGDAYFNGKLDEDMGEYRLNIANWFNDYSKGKKDEPVIYIGVRDSGVVPKRAVLRGGGHPSGGARLEILYTKL